jgi:proline iminopeptidase
MSVDEIRTLFPAKETDLRTLYPPIEPYDFGFLRVSEIHDIFYEQCGNPNGNPAVVFHGGPGGGISPDYRRVFDPEAYRIILIDQRGAGV